MVADVGCGSGMQTRYLLDFLPKAEIIAIDLHESYLRELQKTTFSGIRQRRLKIVQSDMNNLPLEESSLDLIWSEGAIYITGFENGLKQLTLLLKNGGFLGVTEISWRCDDVPQALREFWEGEYPALSTIEQNLQTIVRCGYETVGHFTLPVEDWWSDYYQPLQKRLDILKTKNADEEEAMVVYNMHEQEVQLFREFSDYYGYEFYVVQKN